MNDSQPYRHTQRAPLCLLLYVLAAVFLVLGLVLKSEPPIPWLFPPIGLLMFVLAASFHHLTVEDQIDHLSISFGPLPLFRRTIRYDDIVSAEIGRTTILDGWGNSHELSWWMGLESVGPRLRCPASEERHAEDRHRRC